MRRAWLVALCAAAVTAHCSLPANAQGKKVADTKYWAAVSAAAAVGVGDAVKSKLFRADHPDAWEANPMLGKHPTWLRVLAVGGAVHAGAAFTSYTLKRRHCRFWWLPQAALVGAHIVGVVSTRKVRR